MKIKKKHIKKAIWIAIGLIIFLILISPIYWMFIASFMTKAEVIHRPSYLFPPHPSLEAYKWLFQMNLFDIKKSFFNSLVISLGSMVISVLLSVPAAYGLAKHYIKGSSFIILLFLISQMLPEVFNLAPYLAIFTKIGLFNTYFAPMLAACTISIPFCVIMMRPYFQSVPRELEDAARIDGAGYWTAFTKVILPIASPGVAISVVFSFLFAYGDMMYSLNLMNDNTLWPVTTGIYNVVGRYGIAWNRAMAFAVLVILPVLVIFIRMQKYIVEGLTSGSVKG